ncbi:MAG: pitrilysin family protein, partial [Bacteroidota bacterium]
ACLYTRNDVALKTIPLFAEILFNANFPEHEFVKLVERKKQKFIVNYEKLSYQARLRFSKLLFGKSNPYGLTIDEEAFQKITREEAYQYYQKKYLEGNFFLVVAGKISEEIIQSVSQGFGSTQIPESAKAGSPFFKVEQGNTGRHFVPKEDALQSAIRMGMLMPNKKHEDYNNLKVLNTILGGYFGSRLMTNIREEKGYTYGIGSSLISLRNAGFFVISSEIRADVTSKAIDEIYKEIKVLQNELVGPEELETVKNYMIGNLLRGLDGPFALAEATKSLYMDGLPYDFVQVFADDIRKVNSDQIKTLAKKYFAPEIFLELVIGRI